MVKTGTFSAGGEPMGICKKLERFLAPAIKQGLALKTEKKVLMLSSSRKQHLNCFHQEKFNVG
jgi:hypothetical protein